MHNDLQEFLLREYESAVKLTYHVDDLRAKVVSAFVALAAAVAAVAAAVADERRAVALLLFALAAVGALVVSLTARLRSVQLEHFRIIDNIRRHFLGSDVQLWNVVELSRKTLPEEGPDCPVRVSGSYFWVAAIIVATGFLGGAGTFLLYDGGHTLAAALSAVAVAVSSASLLDRRYFRLVMPRPRPDYKHAP